MWQARWTDKTGKVRTGYAPDIHGTYRLKRDAQKAIDMAYELDEGAAVNPDTVGGYFETWTANRPRSRVTNRTNEGRIKAILDVKLEGVALRDWRFETLRRRHATALVAHMLTVQGRAGSGAQNILRALSAMTEDAIDDEVALANPFRGVRVRANDPRITKPRREVRVWSWEQMHGFASTAANVEDGGDEMQAWRAIYARPMVRVLSDCGLRIGELLALYRTDLDLKALTLQVRRTTGLGEVLAGTKTDHDKPNAGRQVPIPPELAAILGWMPKRIDSTLLFPSPRGRMWSYQGWWLQVWVPAREATGMDARPHEFRHSYVSLLRGAGIDPADLADVAGHSVETATKTYTHGLGRSADLIRRAVGE